MRNLLLNAVILMLITVLNASGQFYETGQEPASVKWLQIKTGRFTVIYPDSYGKQGIIYANTLEKAYSDLLTLYPEKKIKIPVVIHSLTTKSNGYVAWAPRRMELYPTPEQNTIPLATEKQLAIHELAHVFQMKSLNSGFSRLMTIPFGEQFTGMTAALLPLWFMEGDAVFAETMLTESGRGRTASFQKQLKALSVENGNVYKYDKLLNGSYLDYVPDHYESGYQAVAWSKLKYGLNSWNEVMKFTAENPFTIIPVNISLRRIAGMNKRKLYDETFDTLRTIWKNELITENAIKYEIVNPDKKDRFANYYSPVIAGNDSIIAVKTSLDNPSEFVLMNPSLKTEKRIHVPGQFYPYVFSYSKRKMAWVENQGDPRWENRDYSVIKIKDLATGTVKKLSRKSRYQSLCLSPDGTKIIATENSVENKNSIVFIDTETSSIEKKIFTPDNIHLQRPQWSVDGNLIAFIFLSDEGEGIVSYKIHENTWETLLEAGRDDLQSAIIRNDTLYFVSSVSGTENIYFRTKKGENGRLTRSEFGATDLSLMGGKIIFSNYSSSGNNISQISISDSEESGDKVLNSSEYFIERISPEPTKAISSSEISYTPQPYRKWQHMLNFHSWLPFYADLEEIKADPGSVRPGFSLLTQNILSTLVSQTGYEYSQDNRHIIHSRITFSGWYPVLESRIDYGGSPGITKIARQGEIVPNPSVIKPGLRSTNTISLPLRFSSGRFSEFFRPSITADFRNDYIYLNGLYDFGQTIVSGRLYFSNYYRSVQRDIHPRWAQVFDLNYSFAPFDDNLYGTLGTLKTTFYFPGIFPHNSLRIRLEREKQVPVKFLYGNRVSYPRGYKNIMSRELELYSADYVLPLLYPDLSLSSILYLKRIRAGFFYDYGLGTGNSYFTYTSGGVQRVDHDYEETFSSAGFEVLADFHLLRIPYMITGGVQTAWKRSSNTPVFEFKFNIDLYGMTLGKRGL